MEGITSPTIYLQHNKVDGRKISLDQRVQQKSKIAFFTTKPTTLRVIISEYREALTL